MKGKYNIKIETKKSIFELEIKRNITILRGDSATGKSILYKIIENSLKSGGLNIKIDSPVELVAIESKDIKKYENVQGKIIIIDENPYMSSKEFSESLLKSDNYFILITRENPLDYHTRLMRYIK